MKIFNIYKKRELTFLFFSLLGVLILRLPFLLTDISFNNDAEIYSRNIIRPFFSGKYDVQMPGYISYIYLGKILYLFIKNPILIQHVINIILVIVITILVFFILKKLEFNDFESFFFTIIFSCNNVYLLGSITGGNRVFLILNSATLILLAINILLYNKINQNFLFAFFFAFFSGFRQDIIFYYFPLFIYLLFKIKNFKITLVSVSLFIIVSIAWFIPLMLEYSGIFNYINTLKNADAIKETSLFLSSNLIQPIVNIFRLIIYFINSIILIIPFFIYSLIKKEVQIKGSILIILILSFLPAFLLQLFLHNGNFVQLAAFILPVFLFFIINFRLNSIKKIIFASIIVILLLIQFFAIKPIKNNNITSKALNSLILQHSYHGAKEKKIYRLRDVFLEGKQRSKKNNK